MSYLISTKIKATATATNVSQNEEESVIDKEERTIEVIMTTGNRHH